MASGSRATGSQRSADYENHNHHRDGQQAIEQPNESETQDTHLPDTTVDGELDVEAIFAKLNAKLDEIPDDSDEDDGGDEDASSGEEGGAGNGSNTKNTMDMSKAPAGSPQRVDNRGARQSADERHAPPQTTTVAAAPKKKATPKKAAKTGGAAGSRPLGGLTPAQRRAAFLASLPNDEAREAYLADKKAKKAELKKNGFTAGMAAPAPAAETYRYEEDEAITEGDPYHGKCVRRMVFVSDPVPSELQYIRPEDIKEMGPCPPNAIDKFLKWCETRPTSNGKWMKDENGKQLVDENNCLIRNPKWDEAGYEDARLPRHFVLKVGPPNGPFGQAGRLADRLSTICKTYLRTRLRNSHLTIETAIPYNTLMCTNYFAHYMDTLLKLAEDGQLKARLSIKLDPESAQQVLAAQNELFFPDPVTKEQLEQEWELDTAAMKSQSRDSFARHIRSQVDHTFVRERGPGQVLYPPQYTIQEAKTQFVEREMKRRVDDKKEVATEALSAAQAFIRAVQKREQNLNTRAATVAPGFGEGNDEAAITGAGPQAEETSRIGESLIEVNETSELFQPLPMAAPERAESDMSLPATNIDCSTAGAENNVGVQNAAVLTAGIPGPDTPQQGPSPKKTKMGPGKTQISKKLWNGVVDKAMKETHRVHSQQTPAATEAELKITFINYGISTWAAMTNQPEARNRHHAGAVESGPKEMHGLPELAPPPTPLAAPPAQPFTQIGFTNGFKDTSAEFGGDPVIVPNADENREILYWAANAAREEVDKIKRRDWEIQQEKHQEDYDKIYDKLKAEFPPALSKAFIEEKHQKLLSEKKRKWSFSTEQDQSAQKKQAVAPPGAVPRPMEPPSLDPLGAMQQPMTQPEMMDWGRNYHQDAYQNAYQGSFQDWPQNSYHGAQQNFVQNPHQDPYQGSYQDQNQAPYQA